MQILGKRSKVLLIVIAITMLVAVGVSLATWDNMTKVQATNGDLSTYANAKVGDIIEFGRYYQTGNRINNDENAEYEKTAIEWLVVDKDERTGQLTLMSKYILAAGSYFGNYYYDKIGEPGYHYNTALTEIAGVSYNQAYIESTVRAYLNNLERMDLGGDSYTAVNGYKTSVSASVATDKLYTSVGFSNSIYYFTDINFQRPIKNVEYRNRPATRGFYDEAFTNEEKELIVPKLIPGYIGHRWPNNVHDPKKKAFIEGASDKIWIPSATELNVVATNDHYTNASDESGSTVFEYFKGKSGINLQNALKATRTTFVENDSMAMNYSIPLYKYQSTAINEDIHGSSNSSEYYWTRSPVSHFCTSVRSVGSTGAFSFNGTQTSNFGVRPCVILKY